METMSHSSSSTLDELSMQQDLLFSDSLKDLKNLRSQLYLAAEYFELSYSNDDQKQIVGNSLKDYAVKALVNTVDHLGSVSYKVDELLDEKVDEVSGTEFRVSCIEQRLRTCQEHIDHEGLSQQSLVIAAPKYHKRYTLPVGASMPESGRQAMAKYQESNLQRVDSESQEFKAAVRSTIRDRPPSFRKLRYFSSTEGARSSSPSQKARSPSPTPRLGKCSTSDKRTVSPLRGSRLAATGTFSATSDKRAVSPLPSSNPFTRSGSVSIRTNAYASSITRRLSFDPPKSASMRLHAERNDDKRTEHSSSAERNDDKRTEHSSSRGRSFLKSLLSRRRTRRDDMLYTYLDEY